MKNLIYYFGEDGYEDTFEYEINYDDFKDFLNSRPVNELREVCESIETDFIDAGCTLEEPIDFTNYSKDELINYLTEYDDDTFDYLEDDLTDYFHDDAYEQWADEVAYAEDPYAYNGVSPKDFL